MATSNAPQSQAGGCLCGAVRYVTTGPPLNVRVCHCHTCRKITGSAFFARAMFRREAVTVTGETAAYASSEDLLRRFCPVCGSVLFADRGDLLSVTLGTLDDPDALPPQAQVFVSRQVAWLPLDPELPCYDEWVS